MMASEVNRSRGVERKEAEINGGFQISLNPNRHVPMVGHTLTSTTLQ